MDYKETLNLPTTDFPMKANLAQREPELLARWEQEASTRPCGARRRAANASSCTTARPTPTATSTSGTPSTRSSRTSSSSRGRWPASTPPYVPGWDCHGLPIEHKVDKELGAKKAQHVAARRSASTAARYAEKFIDIQREEFKRLGVLGDWEHPYLTMDYDYEATIARELARTSAARATSSAARSRSTGAHLPDRAGRGRGRVPGRTLALHLREVPAHRTTCPRTSRRSPARRSPSSSGPPPPGRCRPTSPSRCTRTSTTSPSRSAASEVYILAKDLVEALHARPSGSRDYARARRRRSRRSLERKRCRHPLYDRDSLIVLGDHVTLEAGHRAACTPRRATAAEDYEIGLQYGLDVYSPVDDRGRFTADVDALRRRVRLRRQPARSCAKLREAGVLVDRRRLQPLLPALLALQEAGHLPRHRRSGSSRWTRPACGARRWRRSTACSGSPPGAASASTA